MKKNYESYNRRQFIKSVSISATTVALFPNFTFGNVELNDKLSISFSNVPLKTITNIKKILFQNDDFVLKQNSANSDIHYLYSPLFDNSERFESIIKNNTILIVNHQNFDTSSLEYLKDLCNKKKTFLLIIDEPQQESEQYLFLKATIFEPVLSDTSKINTIIKSITFLNQVTLQNQFFTINQNLV